MATLSQANLYLCRGFWSVKPVLVGLGCICSHMAGGDGFRNLCCDSNSWILSTYKSSLLKYSGDQNCGNTQLIYWPELTLEVSRRRKEEQLNFIMKFSTNIPYLMLITWLCEAVFPNHRKGLFLLLLVPSEKIKPANKQNKTKTQKNKQKKNGKDFCITTWSQSWISIPFHLILFYQK